MPTITTNSIGSAGGRAYSTPQAWEDAAPANLVTSDVVWRGECYNDSIFTGSTNRLTIAGSTSDATRYKEITAAAGQSFADTPSNTLMFSAANGATLRTTGAYTRTLIVSEAHARISRLQFDLTSGGSFVFEVSAAINVDGCIFHSDTSNGRTGAINNGGNWANSLFLNKRSSAASTAMTIGGAINFTNNLIVNLPGGVAAYGLDMSYASATLRNSVAVGWTAGFTRAANSASSVFSNCFQSDTGTTYTGLTNSLAFTTATFANVTSGTLDFKLVSGSALIDSGTSSGAPTADIFGTSRPSGASYDVGPHEYAPSITDYPVANTEAASLADTSNRTFGAATAISEGAMLADSQAALKALFSAMVEAATLSHSQSIVASLSASLTEAATLSHSQALQAALSAAATEATTLASTQAVAVAGGDFAASATEAATLGHSQTVTMAAAAAVTEAATLSHSQGAVVARAAAITEAATLSHSQAAVVARAAAIAEPATLADTVTSSAAQSASIIEAATLADTTNATAAGEYTGTVIEAAVLDAAQTSSATQSAAIAEPAALDHSQASSAAQTGAVTEAATLGHTQAVSAAQAAAITEPVTLSHSQNATAAGEYTGTITETAAAGDAVSTIRSLAAALAESSPLDIVVSAVKLSPGEKVGAVSEAVALADAATPLRALATSIAEAVVLADVVVNNWAYLANILEAASLGDWASATALIAAERDYRGDVWVMTAHPSSGYVFNVVTRADIVFNDLAGAPVFMS